MSGSIWDPIRVDPTRSFCKLPENSHLIYLHIFGGERQVELAGTARSSRCGTNTATAVAQRCRSFHSDSLQMPPGQEAKINTISNVAQWLACNKKLDFCKAVRLCE